MEINDRRTSRPPADFNANAKEVMPDDYDNFTERAALIGGLRGLADYLESNPEVPAPSYPTVYMFPPGSGWAEKRAEIDAIAARLDVIAREMPGGHYVATRSFGPVEYRAVAIPCSNDSEQSE